MTGHALPKKTDMTFSFVMLAKLEPEKRFRKKRKPIIIRKDNSF